MNALVCNDVIIRDTLRKMFGAWVMIVWRIIIVNYSREEYAVNKIDYNVDDDDFVFVLLLLFPC